MEADKELKELEDTSLSFSDFDDADKWLEGVINPFDSKFDCSDNTLLGDSSLTINSLCDKTKSIFENVIGVPITIIEEDGEHSSIVSHMDENGDKRVNITLGNDGDTPIYTKFNHEMAHYAFDSLNMDFSFYLQSELKQLPKEYIDKALEMYRSVFNVIEDQRVESLMGKIYIGVGKRFESMKKDMGLMKDENTSISSPIDYLHLARELRPDLVPNDMGIANKVMEQVKQKDSLATVLLAKKFINNVLNPWILENIEEDEKANEKESSTGEPKEDTKIVTEFIKRHQENRISDHKDYGFDETLSNEVDRNIEKMENTPEDELLEETSKSIKDKIQSIKDEIEKNARESKSSSNPFPTEIQVIEGNRNSEYEVDTILSKKLRKVLLELQSKNRMKMSDVGDTINIQSYINMLAKGYGDVYEQQKKNNSLHIVIGVDNSGSMNHRIDVARDMLATMFASVKDSKQITIEGYTWSGSESVCAITPMKKLSDCSKCNTSNSYGGTPTDLAMMYGYDILKNSRAKNKMFVLLTDGYPSTSYIARKHGVDHEDASDLLKKEVENNKVKHNIGTLVIGFNCGSREMDMFGKNAFVVDDIETAREMTTQKFKKLIVETQK